MASLYPIIQNPLQFISKRYARIFPVYGVIIFYLFIAVLELKVANIYVQIGALILIALITRLFWTGIKKLAPGTGKYLFYLFIVIQLVVIIFNLLITPKIIHLPQATELTRNILYSLTDLTLTTPFTKEFKSIVAVFWSLAPEVLFYLLYPFLVIPILEIAKKRGLLITILIVLSTFKILLDLNTAFISFSGLQAMNIARASGFVVGVMVGTIYATREKEWDKLKEIFSGKLINILVLSTFLFFEWADGSIKETWNLSSNNYFYLISNFVIGAVIICALINNSIINRIFRTKFLVFLGLISYSMYLIHLVVIEWAHNFVSQLNINLSHPIQSLLVLAISIIGSILIAYMLFQLIESLYFKSKLEAKQRQNLNLHIEKPKSNNISFRFSLISFSFVIGLLILSFSGGISPSILATRIYITTPTNVLSEKPITIPIDSKKNNLSIINTELEYIKDQHSKDPDLVFILLDDKGKKIFTSERGALQIQGEPRYPFGFPIIPDSKGKKYFAQLSIKNNNGKNKIILDNSSTSVLAIYKNGGSIINKLGEFVVNRIYLVSTNPDAIFAIGFFIFLIIISHPKLDLKKYLR